MPPGKSAPLVEPAIGAACRQPVIGGHFGDRQLNTIRNRRVAVGIVTTLATVNVEQLTGHAGRIDSAGLGILEFVPAALATTIAEGFPLGP